MTFVSGKNLICTAFIAGLCLAARLPASEVNEFILNTSTQHQVIDNFGANDAWSIQKIGVAWSETSKNKIADLLFSTNTGIGLSCWRFNLGAGINQKTIRDNWRTAESFETAPGKYDWSRQAGQRWFLRAAKSRDVEQFLATVYSPPLRLTKNGLSNLGRDTNSTTNLKPGTENDFAKYLADIIAHFRDNPDISERINFNFLLPVNEPQWEWQHGQEGCRYANADLKKVFTALHSQLTRDGLNTKILGPESGSIPDLYSRDEPAHKKWQADYGNYLPWIQSDPQITSCFGGVISYHSYWSDDMPDKLVPHREQLGNAFTNFPGWKIWQSEYCIMEPGRDLGMNAALRMARIIHCDLTLVNASSWQWWLAVANEDYKSGLIYTDYKTLGDAETIYESKLLWALGNFSRFIRPGMVRVELSGQQDMNGLMASAFVDEKNGKIVLVFVNYAEAAQNVSLKFAHPPREQSNFSSYLTSAKKNLAAGPKIQKGRLFSIPARSIMTLVSQNTDDFNQNSKSVLSKNKSNPEK